jgi:hypothetical protein
MMNALRNKSYSLNRGLGALCAGSFLFFLCYTAPHRVHHFFDQARPLSHASADDHHSNSDKPNQAPDAADCVFQASANRCADGLIATVQPLATIWRHQPFVVLFDHQYPHQFISATFQSRAPPIA